MLSENMVILRKGGVRRYREPISPALVDRIASWQRKDDPDLVEMPPTFIQLVIDADEQVSPSQRGVRCFVAPVQWNGVGSLSTPRWGVIACGTYMRLRNAAPINKIPCLIDAHPNMLSDGRFIAAFMQTLNEMGPKARTEDLGKGILIFFVS